VRAQQAKSWELRAAKSMARFWRDQGKRNEARDLLRSMANSTISAGTRVTDNRAVFTEGFDTLNLKKAKELLEEPGA
jgi:hypothetical protein